MAVSRLQLPRLPSVKELLRIYELRARKNLSQNFLMDLNLCRKIVSKAGNYENAYVCEIGPGPGGISRAVLEQNVKQFDVIELDGRFLPGLEQLASASENKMRIHHADILRFKKLGELFPETVSKQWYDDPPDVYFIGNLPFNIASPLIIQWLDMMANRQGPFGYGRSKLTLTFQKEVADRIVANIMSKERSRLSVICQYLAQVKKVLDIPGAAFVPKPEVDASVVNFVPLIEPQIELHFKVVYKFVRQLFSFRGKRCYKGIETLFPKNVDRKYALEILRRARVDPTIKPYYISNEEIRDLCIAYYEICLDHPGLFYYESRHRKELMPEDLVQAGLIYPPEYPFKLENFQSL